MFALLLPFLLGSCQFFLSHSYTPNLRTYADADADVRNSDDAFISKARTRQVAGMTGKHSLSDLGYNRAGLDDNWQACHTGRNNSFHDDNGMPLINKTLFKNITGMVAYGHSLGLKVGWYDNNCICGEGRLTKEQVTQDVAGDVKFLTEAGTSTDRSAVLYE